MLNVIKTTEFVVANSKFVKINQENLAKLVDLIKIEDVSSTKIDISSINWKLDDLIRLCFTLNTINFCYWAEKGDEKWSVTINDKVKDGQSALSILLEIYACNNPDFFSGETLVHITDTKFAGILRNPNIPLFQERLDNLHSAGKTLVHKYANDWINVLNNARGDSMVLLKILIKDFHCFHDTSKYLNKEIGFYKRAQLVVKMVSDVLELNDQDKLTSLDELTAFADYKIPQLLRDKEVIEYEKGLEKRIDNMELIKKDSREEVEIRAATVQVVEMLKKMLIERDYEITSSEINDYLWLESRKLNGDVKPYHRTYTTAY